MVVKKLIQPFLGTGEKIYQWGLERDKKKAGEPHKLDARVISVGNITWGGTGKTPMVMLLAKSLAEAGQKVAVLTRGYGNDECQELKDRLEGIPVLVGKDRRVTGQEAIEKHGARWIILDDGFQVWNLQRNYDIVTINATQPFGNGRLIPAGNLREPVEALARANAIVLTQSFLGRHNTAHIRQKLREVNPKAQVFEADHHPISFMDFRNRRPLELDMVKDQRVAILSGIEDPMSFENTLSRLGAKIVYAARFRDHHVFSPRDLKQVFKACQECKVRYLVTTEKDSYRLANLIQDERQPTRVLMLRIEMRMDDEEAFLERCLNPAVSG
ncbi:MAG: tetraacyldisaccharide 4'-kinase [Candidatus Omnitrophica bacterium]|jgi:tetraacyldisaccharide 4'-kinase|nr:tetraacyldisaccharide 4'-kinase [Candidatus Omnitrophota bacterium]